MKIIKTLYNKYKLYFTYLISAGISFFLDMALYTIFYELFKKNIAGAIIIATYLARAISSFINYLINKHKVFNYKKKKNDNTFIQYFGLVIINVTLSAVLVSWLSSIIPIYSTFIKAFIDVLIFISNFFIQNKFIFNNNKKDNKVIKYILPLISFIALCINLDENGIIFNYGIIDYIRMIIILIILYFLYSKIFINIKNNYKTINILSIIFTIFMILGFSYDFNTTPNLVGLSEIHILVSMIKFIGFYFLFKNILYTGLYFIKNHTFKEYNNKIINTFNKHPFIFSFIVMFIVYGIYLIIFYPGVINYDNANQIKEVLGLHTRYLDSIVVINDNITLTNFNPIIHTLLIGSLFKFGVFIGNVNFGLFLYTLFQVLIVISVLSYSLSFLYKEKVKSQILLIILLVYIIIPFFPLYAITGVKDTLFSMFVLLYIIKLYQFIKYDFKTKNYIIFIICILLVILFRNNGIFLILLSLPFALIVKKQNRKQILLLLSFTLIFNFGYGKVLTYLEIPNTSVREALSIPFQQTARYVKYHGDDVTDEEKEIIDKILNYETLGSRYESGLSDKVKNEYNKWATNEELLDYFNVWFKMFFKHPGTYFNATISNIYGYFYPNTYSWYVYTNLNEKLPEAGYNYHFLKIMSPGRDFIKGYSEVFKYIPVVQLSVNCGFYTWIYLFLLVILIICSKKKYILLLAPAFSLILMNVAGPANTYFRYVLPYAISLPTIIGIVLLEINNSFIKRKR